MKAFFNQIILIVRARAKAIVQVLLGKYIGPKKLFQIPNVFPSEGTRWNRATIPMFWPVKRQSWTIWDNPG